MWHNTSLARDLHNEHGYHSLAGELYDLRVGLKAPPPPHGLKYPLIPDFNNGGVRCAYGIGYEVEKGYGGDFDRNDIPGDIDHIPIFHRREADGSCGTEFVTGVLPLAPRGVIRTAVFNEFDAASEIFDLPADKRCGGHVTVSVSGLSGQALYNRLKPYLGLVFALYRHRLKNQYCSADILNLRDPGDTRYRPVLIKSEAVEFRIVRRFESVDHAINRYELFYELVNGAANNHSRKAVYRRCAKVVQSMMGSKDKSKAIFRLARDFDKMLNDYVVRDSIARWISEDELRVIGRHRERLVSARSADRASATASRVESSSRASEPQPPDFDPSQIRGYTSFIPLEEAPVGQQIVNAINEIFFQ